MFDVSLRFRILRLRALPNHLFYGRGVSPGGPIARILANAKFFCVRFRRARTSICSSTLDSATLRTSNASLSNVTHQLHAAKKAPLPRTRASAHASKVPRHLPAVQKAEPQIFRVGVESSQQPTIYNERSVAQTEKRSTPDKG